MLSEKVNNESETPNVKLIDFDLAFQWKQNMREEVKKKEGGRIIGTVNNSLHSITTLVQKY